MEVECVCSVAGNQIGGANFILPEQNWGTNMQI